MSAFTHEHVLALLDPETPPAQLDRLARQLDEHSQITERQATFLRLEAMQRRYRPPARKPSVTPTAAHH